MKTSSFNFKQFCGDKSLMVIVPHEDDEINLAGSSIIAARKENVHVICVFLTNGDWEYPAYIRIREAVNSLKIMGVPDKDVIFWDILMVGLMLNGLYLWLKHQEMVKNIIRHMAQNIILILRIVHMGNILNIHGKIF